VADFETYIKNNSEFIPNFGERWRQGETNQHCVCRINDQPGRQQKVREEATNAMDASGSSSLAPNANQGPQQ